MTKIINRTGHVFGRLTVLHQTADKRNRVTWVCYCACGNTVDVQSDSLRSGHTKSCGCLNREVAKRRNTTHGMSRTPTYETWLKMIVRCTKPNSIGYHNYGGRGISVCAKWRNSFEEFLKDMGVRPLNHSIDRINNNGNYEPSNCRWASRYTQANNSRINNKITHAGTTMNITQWADLLNIKRTTLMMRFARGWDVEKAFFTPVE